MDISPVVSLPVSSGKMVSNGLGTATGTVGNGASGSGQAAPVASNPVPSSQEVSKLAAGIQAPSEEQLAQAVRQVNDTFTQRGQNLYAAFEKDKATGISVVKIVDKSTKEIISQIPSKEIIGFAELLDQSQGKGGQLVYVKA